MAKANKKRRNSKWRFRADISWILHEKKYNLSTKAQKINRALRGLPPFRNPEYKTLLTAMLEAAEDNNKRDFEESIDNLFAFCDWFGVWLSA